MVTIITTNNTNPANTQTAGSIISACFSTVTSPFSTFDSSNGTRLSGQNKAVSIDYSFCALCSNYLINFSII